MNLFKLVKYLLGLALILFVKIPGLLWLLGSLVLMAGMLFLVKRFQRQLSPVPVLVWTAAVVGALFTLAWKMPPIRLVDLLYF